MIELPKHVNPTINERKAVAPYNFVPLPETVVKAVENADKLPNHDTYASRKHPYTGWFEVVLTTKSPIYVRCPLTKNEFDLEEQGKDRNGRPIDASTRYRDRIKNKPDFFHTVRPTSPVIPGSSLHGMLRSLLEIVSYGKMNRVSDKHLIYRSVGDRTALGTWYREQLLGPNRTKHPNMVFDYPSSSVQGGYLVGHAGGWAIRPAKQHLGESFVHVDYSIAEPIIGGRNRHTFHPVFVQPAGRTAPSRGRRGPGNLTLRLALSTGIQARNPLDPTPPGFVPAVLVESGHMGNDPPNPGEHPKHMHCAVFEPDPAAKLIPIPRKMWNAYEEDREMTRGIRTKTRKLTKDNDPLFYLMDNSGNLVFFGPTMMFRLPYQHSTHDLIPDELRSPLTIDYADALFGFIRGKQDFPNGKPLPEQGSKHRAYAGRVAVTDAELVNPTLAPNLLWLAGDENRSMTPPILSGPKPTSFQHYLAQPETERPNLSHYDSPTQDAEGILRGEKTVVRGHKLYWHQGAKPAADLRAKHPEEDASVDTMTRSLFERRGDRWEVKATSTQHTQFKPVNAGVSFRFKVHFENLSDRELGALCWVLNPYGKHGTEYCHSIGMGKPFGMGAVRLNATLRLTNRAARYESLFAEENWLTGETGDGQGLTDAAVLEEYVRPFEKHILDTLGLGNVCTALREVKRIGIVLKMLEWPGPDRQRTKYMWVNRFRDRPVLPDPTDFYPELNSLADPSSPTPPAPSIGANSLNISTALAPSPAPKPSTNPPTKSKPSPPVVKTERESVTLVNPTSGGKALVRTKSDEQITCAGITTFQSRPVGAKLKADVTRENGRAVRAVFKGWV